MMERAGSEKKLMKMLDSQSLLLWSQIFSLEPQKVKENNIISFYIRIPDGDTKLLEKAYNKIIETNDSLRLRFCRTGGFRIRQYIDDFSYESLPVRKLTDGETFEQYLEQIDCHKLPMFGEKLTWAELVEPGDGSIALVMRFHHIIMDGYSIALIYNRIAEAYDSYREGITPWPKQYSILRAFDQEKRYKQSARHRDDRKFWFKSFTFQPHYSLPAGRRSQHGDCDRREISITGKLYQDTMNLTASLGCSLQCLIMSAAAYTVYKLTGKTNFCIYSATHGRFDMIARNTVGCLMNTVPIFFNLDPDKPISEAIQEDYMNFLDTLKHGRLSMTEQTLLSYKEPLLHGFNFNHAWLIMSAMDYQAAFSRSSYEGRFVKARNQPHQFYCSVLEVPGERLDITLNYQTRKYTAEQILHILQAFENVLEIMTVNSRAPVRAVLQAQDPKPISVHQKNNTKEVQKA